MITADVLVVGGGPVGLSAAIALHHQGVSFVLVERHPEPTAFPKAVRSVRARWSCSAVGAWRTRYSPRRSHVPRTSTSTLTDPGYNRFSSAPDLGDYPHSPTFTAIYSQERLEPLLRGEIDRRTPGAARFGTTLTGFDQDADEVTATVTTAEGRTERIRSRYLLGADGPASMVRSACGISLQGAEGLSTNLNILFEADLRDHVADRLSLLYTVDGGVFMAVDNDHRWLLNLVNPPADVDLVTLIRQSTGLHGLTPEVIGHRRWNARAQLAERFRSGRVFLAETRPIR